VLLGQGPKPAEAAPEALPAAVAGR
jgi:hypothetical protein